MAKTETLNLRVSYDFKCRLIEEAAMEKRSITNFLEATLIHLWDHMTTSSFLEATLIHLWDHMTTSSTKGKKNKIIRA